MLNSSGNSPQLMTVQQVADALSVTTYIVRNLITSGQLEAVAVCGGAGQRHRYRVSPTQLRSYCEAARVRHPTASPRQRRPPSQPTQPVMTARALLQEVEG
jgi:excisionase family DNA binding protein